MAFEAQRLEIGHSRAVIAADLDRDGLLDLVTASYDAELVLQVGGPYHRGGGIYVHHQLAGTSDGAAQRPPAFVTQQLAAASQALALLLMDVDGDGQLDIHVGHDFALPDQTFVHRGDRWVASPQFATMSRNTMSLAAGDVDGDGNDELFAADMRPYDAEAQRVYGALLERLAAGHVPDDRQRIANALQMREPSGRWRERAAALGVAASGWSWSAQFGDVDRDGRLDLYVVNGMASVEVFPKLPATELVEANQAYRNTAQGDRWRFVPAPQWGLGSRRGGRSMGMADLDLDGDLDVLVNNLRAPAQLFENQLCRASDANGDHGGGSSSSSSSSGSLQLDLRWPASGNTHAVGARATLLDQRGRQARQARQVRSTSGYLLGEPSRLHFGLPSAGGPLRLQVRWPDGALTVLPLPAGATDRLARLTRTP